MATVYTFDIETLPHRELMDEKLDRIRNGPPPDPGNRNIKPENVPGWQERELAKWIEKAKKGAALDPFTGIAACLSLVDVRAVFEGSRKAHKILLALDEAEERKLLDELVAEINSKDSIFLVGFNVREFDVPFLRWRFARHGMRCPWLFESTPPPWKGSRLIDVRDVFADGNRYAPATLPTIAAFLGLDVTIPATGSDEWDELHSAFLDGNPDPWIEHARTKAVEDTLATAEVFLAARRIFPGHPVFDRLPRV